MWKRPAGRGKAGALLGRLLFPALLLVLALTMTVAGISGTSIGVLDPSGGHTLAGIPRPIRSDEWNVATPLVVAQSHHGYAKTSDDSIGTHDLDVILDIPVKTWTSVFRPWDWGLFFLGVTNGFAARWWTYSLLLLLGAYALLLRWTQRPAVAATFSVALWASPLFQWWYEAASLATVGLALIATVAFLVCVDQDRTWPRICSAALAVWAMVAFALVLYPPYQVPTAIVCVALTVGDLAGRGAHVRRDLRRVGVPLAAILLGSGLLLGTFALDNRTALHLISSTVYPGRRRLTGGTASLTQLLSAPYGNTLAQRGGALTRTNQSEISSFLLWGPLAALQLLRLRLRSFAAAERALLVGAMAALLLVGLWYLIGLPGPLAAMTGLDRSEPPRAIIGVGLAGVVLGALVASGRRAASEPAPVGRERRRLRRETRREELLGAAVVGCVGLVLTFWAGRYLGAQFPLLGLTPRVRLAASVAVGLASFLVAARLALAAGLACALLGVVVALPANPIYRGLAPLTSANQTGVFTRVRGAQHGKWLSFAGLPVNDVLIATGVSTLNAVSIYPDPAAWRILDPTGRQSKIWNRYANLTFIPAPGLATAQLHLDQEDVVRVMLDPCGRQARALGVDFVVLGAPSTQACLGVAGRGDVLGQPLWIYRTS